MLSQILEITLTSRDAGAKERIPCAVCRIIRLKLY